MRNCKIPDDWPVRPRLFVSEETIQPLVAKLELMKGADGLTAFTPRITPLEIVQLWRYRSWNHNDAATEKLGVSKIMRF